MTAEDDLKGWQMLAAAAPVRRGVPAIETTGDAAVDEVAAAIGRSLSPEETFNVSSGLPYDWTPRVPERSPETSLTPEQALAAASESVALP